MLWISAVGAKFSRERERERVGDWLMVMILIKLDICKWDY